MAWTPSLAHYRMCCNYLIYGTVCSITVTVTVNLFTVSVISVTVTIISVTVTVTLISVTIEVIVISMTVKVVGGNGCLVIVTFPPQELTKRDLESGRWVEYSWNVRAKKIPTYFS